MEITTEEVKPQQEIELKNALIEEGRKVIGSAKLEEWKIFLERRNSYTLTAMSTALRVIKTLNRGESVEKADDIIGDATGAISDIIATTVIRFCERREEFELYYKNKYNIS